ncbi:MAG: phytoene desaturase family protein [Flavobacteriaceae bacterium]
MKKNVVIVGAGVNGLVAANYLNKHDFNVTILEKKNCVGGACVKDSTIINNKKIDFAQGATVLGMMPNFIYKETGLSKKIKTFCPENPKLVYFENDTNPTRIYRDITLLEKELRDRWNEKGDVRAFRDDENKVIEFIQKIYKDGTPPNLDQAVNEIGKELTKLWIKGSAKDLLDHYFTSEKTKVYMGMTVIESSPTSYNEKGTSFTIPLMDSGSIFGGYWGFVKDGIWKISDELLKLNNELGIKTILNSEINDIDTNKGKISYTSNNIDSKIYYDYLLFCTDPLTPSKILKDKSPYIKKKNYLGSSGKLTMFFKKPIEWKKEKTHETSFRFIFSQDTLDDLNNSGQMALNSQNNYTPGYIQIYPDGAAQRKLNNSENFDKIICFTKNFSFNKQSYDLIDAEQNIIEKISKLISNQEDLVGTKFLTPKDLNKTFFFPEGNIDHIAMDGSQNFNKRTFSSNPKTKFYNYNNYENIYYGGAGIFPCGSIAGTPGYMSSKQIISNYEKY